VTASTRHSDRYIQYREFQTPCGPAHRPILDARFSSGPDSIELPMLVDSGADNVVLPSHALDFLNLNPAHFERISANTLYGGQEGLLAPAIRISFPDLWPDLEFSLGVVFTPFLDSFAYGLLGRDPTFDHLSVRFGHQDGFGFHVRFEQ